MNLNRRKYAKFSIVTLIFIATLLFSNIILSIEQTNIDYKSNNERNSDLTTLSRSSTYERQSVDEIQPVGKISLISINSLADGEFIIENNTLTHGGILAKELLDNKIKYEYQGYELVKVLDNATIESRNNQNEGFIDIRLNNTIKYTYWENHTRSVISYRSEFSQQDIYSSLYQMTINGTQIDTNQVEIYEGGYIYNYSSYKEVNENGTLIVTFTTDFNLTIRTWQMKQFEISDNNATVNSLGNLTNNIKAYYNYTFSPAPVDTQDSNRPFLLDFSATYKIDLPDKGYLHDISMGRYHTNVSDTTKFTGYTLNEDNSLVITVDSDPVNTVYTYSINFVANFTIEFKNVHSSLWARDYLFEKNDIRKREYQITVTEGPDEILVGYFSFNETNIPFNDVYSVSSAFNRVIMYFDNATKISNGTAEGIIILFQDGFSDYYLAKGEVDVITVKYRADNILSLVVLDSTNLPLSGITLKIYYDNITYGTMMSNELVNSIPLKITNDRGQVIINDVPYGYYTISIFQNGNFIENVTVKSRDQISYIHSSIPQFPTWILVFTGINVIILIAGIFIQKKK